MPSQEEHHNRIRFRARWLSAAAALAVPVTIAFWFLYRLVVCTGHFAPDSKLYWLEILCPIAQAIPDVALLGVLVLLGFAVLALDSFAEEFVQEVRPESAWRINRHRRHVANGYRGLNPRHQSIVWFAFETSVWAGAALLFTLVFYLWRYAFPLGLLVLFAVGLTLFRLIRRLFRGAPGTYPGPQDQPPTPVSSPTSEQRDDDREALVT